jgi:hypothetical protein
VVSLTEQVHAGLDADRGAGRHEITDLVVGQAVEEADRPEVVDGERRGGTGHRLSLRTASPPPREPAGGMEEPAVFDTAAVTDRGTPLVLAGRVLDVVDDLGHLLHPGLPRCRLSGGNVVPFRTAALLGLLHRRVDRWPTALGIR